MDPHDNTNSRFEKIADAEVAGRLLAIGRMGDDLAAGLIELGDAVELTHRMLDDARWWCE